MDRTCLGVGEGSPGILPGLAKVERGIDVGEIVPPVLVEDQIQKEDRLIRSLPEGVSGSNIIDVEAGDPSIIEFFP